MSEPALAPPDAPCPGRPRSVARQAWVERLARFAQSGLGPSRFCAAEGVSLPSFYAWRRRLSAEQASPPAGPAADGRPGPRVLPVRLAPAGAAVELVLPSGAVLRVGPNCDLAFVRALVEAVGGPSC
jgi:transposase